jgi:hypothetical protein
MNITDDAKKQLTVYIPDTRGVTISRFGIGNLKIGLGVFTYSRLPGRPVLRALGFGRPREATTVEAPSNYLPQGYGCGTCPGSTPECESICYAARPVAERGPVAEMWIKNSATEDVPAELPPGCTLLRLHISGDFSSERYIDGWRALIERNPSVKVWAYTRSWRVPTLLPALERLRALSNVQLFASMDVSTKELPPTGWRRAWIDGDPRAGAPLLMRAHGTEVISEHNTVTFDGSRSYVCPEETNRRANCESCRYCIDGQRNDVTFLKH